VPDIEEALAALAAKGFRLLNASPVPGADGKRIAFLHPEAGNGVLLELSQDARAAR
jgi:methylmalonyl-CoA/ethylmalonyl-CoA epimerase